ncbi:MAG: PilZ domain-containing protein [Magnetococcales bacterium]|nr:PilZ domain-containing protein [Magnetococcales bacterium]
MEGNPLKPETTKASNRRRFRRQSHDAHLELVMADGRSYRGVTRDVSMNGVFLNIPKPAMDLKIREKGLLERQAAFGMAVTQEILGAHVKSGLGEKMAAK